MHLPTNVVISRTLKQLPIGWLRRMLILGIETASSAVSVGILHVRDLDIPEEWLCETAAQRRNSMLSRFRKYATVPPGKAGRCSVRIPLTFCNREVGEPRTESRTPDSSR